MMQFDSVIGTETTTRDKLAVAALAEFNRDGYSGTNTNKIARSAGFAPQTFYRNFTNKLDAFLAAYEEWQREERRLFSDTLSDTGRYSIEVAAEFLQFHRDYAVFLASLSKLAADYSLVADARANSRQRQILSIASGRPAVGQDPAEILAALLAAEAITDGVALGYFDVYGDEDTQLGLIADAIQRLMPIGA